MTENQKKLVVRLHRIMSDWSMRYVPAPLKLLPVVAETLAEVERQMENDIALNDGLRLRIEDAFDQYEKDVQDDLRRHDLIEGKGKEEEHGDQPEAGERRTRPE